MFISKKNNSKYININVNDIYFHTKQLKSLIAKISDDNMNITQNELNAGLEAVKEILINENETELLKEYFSMFCQVSSEDAKLKYAKEFKKDEINKARDNAIECGVSYKDKIFQSAEKDRNLLTSTVSLFTITKKLPDGFVWISKDNEAVPFTLQELIQLGSIMANSVNINTIKARTIKDKVEQAQTLEEIQSIKWDE
ncbi:TPA: DUF4376 domain-containing protein [Campylobacter jejuni]|nr:DUF4376 domain-containing protein [Campylobacter jejuni]HEC2420309.1 DUF4376 domain-containing protein [Campylobacter jejuni]